MAKCPKCGRIYTMFPSNASCNIKEEESDKDIKVEDVKVTHDCLGVDCDGRVAWRKGEIHNNEPVIDLLLERPINPY